MRRVTLLFAAGLVGLSALLPVTAHAQTTLIENVTGVEYAVGACPGGASGSFAGIGSPSATFDTTICHTATAIVGGSFQLASGDLMLVGKYQGGTLTAHPPMSIGGGLCTQDFGVIAVLGPTDAVPEDATNITSGSAVGTLTHYGVLTASGCYALAATIKGQATLIY